MPIVKMPASITSKEALKIVQGQGFHTIISITELPDGSKLIEAKQKGIKCLLLYLKLTYIY